MGLYDNTMIYNTPRYHSLSSSYSNDMLYQIPSALPEYITDSDNGPKYMDVTKSQRNLYK